MNDCPKGEIRDLLPDLLHGRLSTSERERVEAHVATCALCDAELALLRDLRATMRRVPTIDTSAIAAAIPPYRAPARRSWAGWRAAAAIATIAIGGTSIAIATRSPDLPKHAEAPSASIPVERQPVAGVAPSVMPPAPSSGSSEQIASTTTPVRQPTAPAAEASAGELAMGGGTESDLSDRELSALLDEIETLDALPSADVESALPMTPLAPTGGGR
jgi:anti-sigma factor RsiW